MCVAWILALGLAARAAPAEAQRRGGGGQPRYEEPGDNPRYDGRYTFARLRYEMGVDANMGFRGGRGLPPWAHDYPRGERNFTKILAELTTIRTRSEESVVLALDDPELLKYPVSYMSEPGYWRPNDREASAFRTYLQKGGFVIFDDFREYDWINLEAQMKRVLPEARFIKIDGTHPIFDSFYRLEDPETLTSYGRIPPTYWALFEDNDPTKRMIAIADRDNDLSEYWEWSDTGIYAVDLSNEAYKIGINYLVYALSR
ncbi:MAG: DUF4159 domain-containing protein [Gemmatimonadota bacterium]|nr:DUF4159 domain-containing protein [Gemmatimonadota bacterium]